MKKFLFALLVCVMTVLFSCETVDTKTRHESTDLCYYGDVNPADLMNDAKYQIVKRDGHYVAVPGPGFYIVGFTAVDPRARARNVMAVLAPQGITAYAYKVRGKWYAFHFDSEQMCYVHDGEFNEKQVKDTEAIYKMIFREEEC